MKIDPIYNASQKISQKEWVRANPGYWKQYRRNNPEKAERNRILQAIRNRKARSIESDAKMGTSLIAKMDASKIDNFPGTWAVLVNTCDCKDGRVKSKYRKDSNSLSLIAKMDSLGGAIKL